VLTLVFATYAIVLAPSLLLFGQLSDRFGRRALISGGLAAAVVGRTLFAPSTCGIAFREPSPAKGAKRRPRRHSRVMSDDARARGHIPWSEIDARGRRRLSVRPRIVIAWEYATCSSRTDWRFDAALTRV
jgi:hypothetical protein